VSGANARKAGIASVLTARAAVAPRRPLVLATLITAVAGFLDAVGYGSLHHLFVSFMSGNSTHLGMSLTAMDWSTVLGIGVIVGAFVTGAMVGTLIADASGRFALTAVLGTEFLVFLIAIELARNEYAHAALALVALTMGMQNTLHQTIAGADIGKSFITGTLFALGESLARTFRKRGNFAKAGQNALSWVVFIAGVATGSLVLAAIGIAGCLAVIASVLLVTIVATAAGWL
jgi:Predicted membrane protein